MSQPAPLSLASILAECRRKLRAGEPLDRRQLLAEHPEYAESLALLFEGMDLTQPQRTVAPDHEVVEASLAPNTVVGNVEATIDLGRQSNPPVALPSTQLSFGDYEVLNEIARGGMGVVYRARQISLNRVVAIKMILAGQLAHADDVRRFRAEAEAAAKLDHPGIVPIFEVGEHAGQHFFAMAFIEGKSLSARVLHHPPPPREAADITRRISEAVHYAHLHGVIHRDLKPANVLVDSQGQPRVTDFGLAKQMHADSDLTGTGQILGTPAYMPPEQAAGRLNEVGPQSDVYSLGAILYALLTSRPPFQGANALEVLQQVMSADPVRPRHLNSQVPHDLETICLKCLEKSPGARYRTANELTDDLQRFLDDEPILARPPNLISRARRWMKRRPVASALTLLALGLVFLALSVAGVGGMVILVGRMSLNLLDDFTTAEVIVPIEPTGQQTTRSFHVDPNGLHDLRLVLQIETTQFDVNESAPNARYAKYDFPVKYTLLTDGGETVASGSQRVAWNSSVRVNSNESFDELRQILTIKTGSSLSQFRVPPPGNVKVDIELSPDDTFQAKPSSVELQVQEHIDSGRPLLLSTGALCCLSPLLLMLGLGMVVYSPMLLISRRKRELGQVQP